MNHKVSFLVLLSMCLLTSCTKKRGPTQTEAQPHQKSAVSPQYPYYLAELTPETKAACVAAIAKMQLIIDAQREQPANSMAEAQGLIWRNISIHYCPTGRACVEHNGWFLISSLNTGDQDDGSFKTGLAVKKGSTGIYEWR